MWSEADRMTELISDSPLEVTPLGVLITKSVDHARHVTGRPPVEVDEVPTPRPPAAVDE
jgi:hypothetical protein